MCLLFIQNCAWSVVYFSASSIFLLSIFLFYTMSPLSFSHAVQPLFYNPIMRSVDVMENSSFTLTCQAFAHPLPAITWLSMPTIDATPSITVNSLMNSTSMYRIGRVAAQGNTFQYTVTCRAANSVGSNTATTTVTITSKAPRWYS